MNNNNMRNPKVVPYFKNWAVEYENSSGKLKKLKDYDDRVMVFGDKEVCRNFVGSIAVLDGEFINNDS